MKYVKDISHKSGDDGAVGHPNVVDFKPSGLKAIAVQVQCCNTGVLLRKIDRLT